MNTHELEALLVSIHEGDLPVAEGLERLKAPPVLDLGHTRIDTHRELRCGFPEVVYGAGKTPAQLVDICTALARHHERLLVTRVTEEGAAAVTGHLGDVEHYPQARALTRGLPAPDTGLGLVAVISAGTSDQSVAEEAALTARMLGAKVRLMSDVGVAGLHRLLENTAELRAARVLVVVAGMEGALPSVVGGLVENPIIAVPTSVGYGASFGGIAALLAMLNSCASGVSVVNIDNGFGAGYSAALINRLGD